MSKLREMMGSREMEQLAQAEARVSANWDRMGSQERYTFCRSLAEMKYAQTNVFVQQRIKMMQDKFCRAVMAKRSDGSGTAFYARDNSDGSRLALYDYGLGPSSPNRNSDD